MYFSLRVLRVDKLFEYSLQALFNIVAHHYALLLSVFTSMHIILIRTPIADKHNALWHAVVL